MNASLLKLVVALQADIVQRINEAERTQYLGESFGSLVVQRTSKSFRAEKEKLINELTEYATYYNLDTRENKCWFGASHWLKYRDIKTVYTYREYSIHYYIDPLKFLKRVAFDVSGKENVIKFKSTMNFFQ